MIEIEQGTQVVLNLRPLKQEGKTEQTERYFNNDGRPYTKAEVIRAFGDKSVVDFVVERNDRGLVEITPVLKSKTPRRIYKKKAPKKKANKPVLNIVAHDVEELTTREGETTSTNRTEEPLAE